MQKSLILVSPMDHLFFFFLLVGLNQSSICFHREELGGAFKKSCSTSAAFLNSSDFLCHFKSSLDLPILLFQPLFIYFAAEVPANTWTNWYRSVSFGLHALRLFYFYFLKIFTYLVVLGLS